MSYYNGPRIIPDGLQLCLDAGNKKSYPGTGTSWVDISGNGRNYTTYNSMVWNSDGYFVFDGTDDYMLGPASNAFGLAQEHTVEVIIKPTELRATTLFNWVDSGGGRQIMAHVPWSNDNIYYDVGGCCAGNTRVNYTTSPSLVNRITHVTFRTRTSTTPYRQVFENAVEKVNSSTNSTATMTFGSTAAIIGAYASTDLSTAWKGNLYIFRLYNRALTDVEVLLNYNATKSRFGL
jgi:hypothetical protein